MPIALRLRVHFEIVHLEGHKCARPLHLFVGVSKSGVCDLTHSIL